MSQINSGGVLSNDAQALMVFQSNKKSMGLAYLLWFFVGMFGAHRFYLGRTGSGVAQLILCILGWATLVAYVGAFMLGGVAIWVIVDAFLIPGWVKLHNMRLMTRLTGGASPLVVAATS